MNLKSVLLGLSLALLTYPAHAAEDLFGLEDDLTADSTEEAAITTPQIAPLSSFLNSKIPASTARNIEKAEKVFCYTVNYAAPNEQGYLIDDLAVTGSCGELSATGQQLIRDTLLTNTGAFANNMDNCKISPKMILRYVYGPDHTDVLLSYPCPALIFFHGRDITTVNAAPGDELLKQITVTYGNLAEKYRSPALLGQMVANGQIITQDQKEIVRKLDTNNTNRKKWTTPAPQAQTTEEEKAKTEPVKKGWNKLR